MCEERQFAGKAIDRSARPGHAPRMTRPTPWFERRFELDARIDQLPNVWAAGYAALRRASLKCWANNASC